MFSSFHRFSRRSSMFTRRGFSTETPRNSRTFLWVGAAGLGLGSATGAYMFYTRKEDDYFAASAKQAEPALNPQEWKKFYVSGVEVVNHNTKIFRFKLDTPETPLGMPVASCILTKAPIAENGKDLVRPYTPITPADTLGYFDLMIKRYPTGNMSRYIHSLNVGDFIEIKGPISKIPYKANMKKQIGMIAGGTGITPMLQLLNEILQNPKDQTQVSLVFANIAEEDILLRKTLDEFAKKHKNFKVYYVLEKPPKNWKGGIGFVGEDIIRTQLPKPSDDSLIMVCGPPGMMKAISGEKAPDFSQGELDGLLKKLGYAKTGVFKF